MSVDIKPVEYVEIRMDELVPRHKAGGLQELHATIKEQRDLLHQQNMEIFNLRAKIKQMRERIHNHLLSETGANIRSQSNG